MKKSKYILFTAGRGPIECSLAVHGIQKVFKKYLESQKIRFEIVSQKKGQMVNSLETIVFELHTHDQSMIVPWLGSIQWKCKSPIRKFHKRSNWYIKCEEIKMPEKIKVKLSEIKVQSFRASGPGGQHRNKVETAIRVTHPASGIVVTASDGKSQAQNKKKALKKLNDQIHFKNQERISAFDHSQWNTQIVIERGNPIKIFTGKNFKSAK